MQTDAMEPLTTDDLKKILRELESPENRWARQGMSESEQQRVVDHYCAELGRRED